MVTPEMRAQEHVTLTADGRVASKLKGPFRDGTVWARPCQVVRRG